MKKNVNMPKLYLPDYAFKMCNVLKTDTQNQYSQEINDISNLTEPQAPLEYSFFKASNYLTFALTILS